METQWLEVQSGPDTLRIPYVEIVGTRDGPSGFISGGMHGNEINGIAITRRWLERAAQGLATRMGGRVVVLPLLNPSGFAHMQRRVFEDDQDLNRSFGFDEPSSMSRQIAHDLSDKIFRHCQFGVDIHDAGGRAALVPHSRVHSGDDVQGHRNTQHMGRLFGTKIVVARPGKAHMMAIELNRQYTMPVLTVEVGGGQRLYDEYTEDALQGLDNILAAFGMLDQPIVMPEEQFLLNDRYGVKTSQACEVRLRVRLGASVHAGDELGELYFPHRNERESIRSTMCGYVFSLWDSNQAPKGATLYSILEEHDCHVPRTTLEHFKLLPELTSRRIKM